MFKIMEEVSGVETGAWASWLRLVSSRHWHWHCSSAWEEPGKTAGHRARRKLQVTTRHCRQLPLKDKGSLRFALGQGLQPENNLIKSNNRFPLVSDAVMRMSQVISQP